MTQERRDTEDRTGKYGGDDGALENEQALIAPGEDPGAVDSTDSEPHADKTQAERKQDADIESGEEQPG